MTILTELNDDVFICIFNSLDIIDLLKCTLVCKRWYCIINGSKDIWRTFIPKHQWINLDNIGCFAGMISAHLFKVKREFWLPDPYELFERRNQYTKVLTHLNYLIHDSDGYKRSVIRLYRRLNPVYDLIYEEKDAKNEEFLPEQKLKENRDLLDVLDFIWKKFDLDKKADGHKYLPSVESLWKRSTLLSPERFIAGIQCVLEPGYLRNSMEGYQRTDINEITKSLETDGFTLSDQDLLKISEIIETVKNDVDIKVIKEHSNILREDVQAMRGVIKQKVKRFYRRPSLSFYRKLTKIMFGPEGDWKVRRFYLSDGCFNQNIDFAYQLYVGRNFVVHLGIFYEQ